MKLEREVCPKGQRVSLLWFLITFFKGENKALALMMDASTVGLSEHFEGKGVGENNIVMGP